MASEEILISISESLGQIRGTLDTSIKAQGETNKALFKLAGDARQDIDDLKAMKNKTLGLIVASSVSGSGLGAAIMKLLGMSSHGS